MAAKLVDLFVENFAQFADQVDEGVRQAAPQASATTSASPRRAKPPQPDRPVADRAPSRTRPMTDYRPTTFHQRRRDRASRRALPRALAAQGGVDARSPSRDHDLAAVAAARTSTWTRSCPDLIRRYNESVGGVNSDSEGYHETITRVFLAGVRLFLGEADAKEPLHELVNELLLSPMGRRDWPLRFYSRERLLSRSRRGGHSSRRTSPCCLRPASSSRCSRRRSSRARPSARCRRARRRRRRRAGRISARAPPWPCRAAG